MLKKGIMLCVVVALLLCFCIASADGFFLLSTDSENWNWEEEQLLSLSLTNQSGADLTDLTLVLTAATEDGKAASTPVFYRKGIRRLSTKNRKPSFEVKNLSAGAAAEYTLKYELQDKQTKTVAFALQVYQNGQLLETLDIAVARSADSVGAYAVPLARGISVGHVLKALKLFTLICALGACFRFALQIIRKKRAGR